MTIKTQAYLQGYLHEKTADTQEFGLLAQLRAAAKSVPGGLWQGVKNVGRGAKGLAETVAGGIGTAGAGVLGNYEDYFDAQGWTDDATNTWRDTAKTMADFTRAGAKNVGDVYGAGGRAGLRGDRGDHVTKLHDQVMDEYGADAVDKFLARASLGTGRVAAEGATYIAGPGLIRAGYKGSVGAARAATGASRVPAALTGLMEGGAAHVGKATEFTSVPQALKTLWSPAGRRVATVAAGATGIETGAETAKAVMKAYREPWLSADMREILGPAKAAETENKLREFAMDYAKDYFTPAIFRNEPLNSFDKAVGDAAWSYGKGRALNELKKTWGASGANLPTGPHVSSLAAKRFLSSYLPESSPNISDAPTIRQYIASAGQAGSDIGTSKITGGLVDVGRVASPESLSEAGGMTRRAGGVAGRRIGEQQP